MDLYCNKGFLRLDKDTPEPTPPLDRRLQATVAAAVAGEVAVVVAEMVAKVVVTAAKAVAGGGGGERPPPPRRLRSPEGRTLTFGGSLGMLTFRGGRGRLCLLLNGGRRSLRPARRAEHAVSARG